MGALFVCFQRKSQPSPAYTVRPLPQAQSCCLRPFACAVLIPAPAQSFLSTQQPPVKLTPTCPSLALPADQFGLLWGFLQHQFPLPNRLSTLKRRHESFLTPLCCLPGYQCWEGRAYACLGVTSVSPEDLAHNQFSSVAQSCLTLCDPMNRGTPGLPVHHQLPEFTQTHAHRVGDAIQPPHPLLSPPPLPPVPPSIRVVSNESTLCMT